MCSVRSRLRGCPESPQDGTAPGAPGALGCGRGRSRLHTLLPQLGAQVLPSGEQDQKRPVVADGLNPGAFIYVHVSLPAPCYSLRRFAVIRSHFSRTHCAVGPWELTSKIDSLRTLSPGT